MAFGGVGRLRLPRPGPVAVVVGRGGERSSGAGGEGGGSGGGGETAVGAGGRGGSECSSRMGRVVFFFSCCSRACVY